MSFFYNKPTRVIFIDEEGNHLGGIAYQDIIICGECGGIFEGDSCYIEKDLPWIDISKAIAGEI